MDGLSSALRLDAGKHCLYSVLHNLFTYQNKQCRYEEYRLFLLCNGLSFTVTRTCGSDFFYHLLESVKIDYIEQLKQLSHRLCAPLFYREITNEINEQEMLREIAEILRKDKPVFAFLKSKILKYHVLENPLENLGAHCVLVETIDRDRQEIYLADSFVTSLTNRISTHRSTISFRDFFHYLIGYGFFETAGVMPDETQIRQYLLNDLSVYLSRDDRSLETVDGFDALQLIMDGLDNILRGEKMSETVISIIFLLKAFLLMTFPYLEQMLSDFSFEEQDKKRLFEKAANQKKDWTAFFLRLLTLEGKSQGNALKTFGIGKCAMFGCREFLTDCVDSLKKGLPDRDCLK